MKKSGTLEHLRECVEEQMDAITERHRKCFEDVAGGDGTPASKAITAALIHDMMVKEISAIDEKFRKLFEDLAASSGSPLLAVEYHKMMSREVAPLRRTLAELKRMERGS